MSTLSAYDKCGLPVANNDNAVTLDAVTLDQMADINGNVGLLMSTLSACDKCGLPVAANDNAVALDRMADINGGVDFPELFGAVFQARHLQPSDTCAGSPTRWRRVEQNEAAWVAAFNQLQSNS